MSGVTAWPAAGREPAGDPRPEPGSGAHTPDAGPERDLDVDLSELVDNLNLVFTRVQTLLKESAARVHPELQPATYKLLTLIARSDGVNACHLAEVFAIDKSVISRQVRVLEDLGLVQSRPDENDGRVRVLTATDTAREALATGTGERAERLRGALARLTPEEVRTASKAFRLLAES